MEEYDENFVESLLEGVKAKVRSIGDSGVYALFKYFFYYLEINCLFHEKILYLFPFFRHLIFTIVW